MKITKGFPQLKPEVSNIKGEVCYRYDFCVYLSKFKNGSYLANQVSVTTLKKNERLFANYEKTVQRVLLETILQKVKEGRYHDWGFIK